MNKPGIVIGLTGQTGAGKTSASLFLRQMGICVIDADIVSRKVTQKGSESLEEIAKTFSPAVLNPDGTLNRRALGKIVFADPHLLHRLEKILYPAIMKQIKEDIQTYAQNGERLVVLDAPTLYESGCDKLCDKVIAVCADEQTRFARLLLRDHLTEQEVRERIGAQHDEAFYSQRADFTIYNEQGLDALKLRLEGILEQIQTEYHL